MRDERRRDGLASARLENTKVMRRKDFFHLRLGNGAPDRIRTCGPQIRNLVLYPAELRAPKEIFNWPPAIMSQPVRVNEKTGDIRSEERRVGKECVGTWSYRGPPSN